MGRTGVTDELAERLQALRLLPIFHWPWDSGFASTRTSRAVWRMAECAVTGSAFVDHLKSAAPEMSAPRLAPS